MRQREERDRREERARLRAHGEARRELTRHHGIYRGDPVAEAREERSRDFDRIVADWLSQPGKVTT